jgi:hypothetical protein
VEQQLKERKLVLLFDLPLLTESAYYIVLPESAPRKIATEFADWAAGRLQGAQSASALTFRAPLPRRASIPT